MQPSVCRAPLALQGPMQLGTGPFGRQQAWTSLLAQLCCAIVLPLTASCMAWHKMMFIYDAACMLGLGALSLDASKRYLSRPGCARTRSGWLSEAQAGQKFNEPSTRCNEDHVSSMTC